jgi:hypothetical protein
MVSTTRIGDRLRDGGNRHGLLQRLEAGHIANLGQGLEVLGTLFGDGTCRMKIQRSQFAHSVKRRIDHRLPRFQADLALAGELLSYVVHDTLLEIAKPKHRPGCCRLKPFAALQRMSHSSLRTVIVKHFCCVATKAMQQAASDRQKAVTRGSRAIFSTATSTPSATHTIDLE